MEKFNKQGLRVVFTCRLCGEEFHNDDIVYISSGDRLCKVCFEDWKKVPFSVQDKMAVETDFYNGEDEGFWNEMRSYIENMKTQKLKELSTKLSTNQEQSEEISEHE